jgi:outer membrane PBP1 activator LpoA protein
LPNWKDQSFYLDKELDLERVSIIDLPWMFNSEISYLRNLPKKRNRYFAFGYDSYDIALLLNNPSSTRQFKYTGMSGELSYKNGILSRKSLKTEISEGLFKVIGY